MEVMMCVGYFVGLNVVWLLKEFVVAALAYGVDVDEDEIVFVFDFGGGMFDVSVLEVGGGIVEVLVMGGDLNLGGDDFDCIIVVWFAFEAKSFGVDVDFRGALSVVCKVCEVLSD